MLDFSTLNKSQLAAVQWNDGPLLVLAGPGSGKTRVLTSRIARLVDESAGQRFRILGITFTNKAASEMRTRIDALIRAGRERVHPTTFHSFAAEILRQHGSHVGLKPDFTILTEDADREAVVTDVVKSALPVGSSLRSQPRRFVPMITRMAEECIRPNEATSALKGIEHSEEIAAVYSGYREELLKTSQLDFATLLAMAVDLLESTPAVAKQLRKVYSYVCVDECQDTNVAQYRLLVQLVPAKQPNLFVVADDDQLIYAWNGADASRLDTLRTRFDMTVMQLPENFRCPPEVIELANRLISHNLGRTVGKLPLAAVKATQTGAGVRVHKFASVAREMEWIAEQIKLIKPAARVECVVLGRRKRLLEIAVAQLAEAGVAAHIAVRRNEFQCGPFRWLHSLLRLANLPADREQLARVSRTFYLLEGVTIDPEKVVAAASVQGSGFLRQWLDLAEARTDLDKSTRACLAVARASLLDQLDYRMFAREAEAWFEKIKNKPGKIETGWDEYEQEKEVWNHLSREILAQYQEVSLPLHGFLQEMDLRSKELPAPANSVKCLTIHAAKGLEFKHVFLIGLAEDELPSWAAVKEGDDSDEMREERRNCFVAITRAEQTLSLTYSAEYDGRSRQPSRFLKEMGVSPSSPR